MLHTSKNTQNEANGPQRLQGDRFTIFLS